MTTIVKVQAHCNEKTEVRVTKTGYEPITLLDGQETEVTVEDDRLVRIQEIPRSTVAADDPEPSSGGEEEGSSGTGDAAVGEAQETATA
ncbi:MAG: hypothetical protein AAGI11_15130 [Pseudomonadota bacterium]